MTTNNPPIAAWAPSTALAKLASRHNNAPCVLTDGPAELNDVALIRLSDHEALQAECEKLRKDAERYRHLRDRLTGPRFDNLFFLELYNAGCFDHPDDVDEEIDAAMEAPDAP